MPSATRKPSKRHRIRPSVNPGSVFDLSAKGRVILWQDGEPDRMMQVRRPCPCGCDGGRVHGVGYLSGSNRNGAGITIWLQTEADYLSAHRIFGGEP